MVPLRLAALASLVIFQTAYGFLVGSRNLIREEIVIHAKLSDVNTSSDSNETNHQGRRDFFAAASMSCVLPFFLPSQPAFADDEGTTLHILNYPIEGKCGEAKVPENGVFFAKTFGKLEDGSCAAEGYTVDEGTTNGTGEKDQKRIYNIYGK